MAIFHLKPIETWNFTKSFSHGIFPSGRLWIIAHAIQPRIARIHWKKVAWRPVNGWYTGLTRGHVGRGFIQTCLCFTVFFSLDYVSKWDSKDMKMEEPAYKYIGYTYDTGMNILYTYILTYIHTYTVSHRFTYHHTLHMSGTRNLSFTSHSQKKGQYGWWRGGVGNVASNEHGTYSSKCMLYVFVCVCVLRLRASKLWIFQLELRLFYNPNKAGEVKPYFTMKLRKHDKNESHGR